jgi:hypothetical protein
VAKGDDDAAEEHGAALANELVGDPASREGEEVDARAIHAVDRARLDRVEPEAAVADRGRHVQHEQRAHPVVAESLEELSEEERRQPARVTEKARISRHRGIRVQVSPGRVADGCARG